MESSKPTDKFTPRMLDVDVPENLASVFTDARRMAVFGTSTRPSFDSGMLPFLQKDWVQAPRYKAGSAVTGMFI
jgi:hypothetical protein